MTSRLVLVSLNSCELKRPILLKYAQWILIVYGIFLQDFLVDNCCERSVPTLQTDEK